MIDFSFRRFSAFVKKESLQVIRDPSSILIAVVLPLLLTFLYGYAMSLDANKIRIGLVLEDRSTKAYSLAAAFTGTPFFAVIEDTDRQAIEKKLIKGEIRGIVVIQQDFSKSLDNQLTAAVQVIADGSETNTANFVINYSIGVINTWVSSLRLEKKVNFDIPIEINTRVWFNPELKSRYVLLPGSIAIIMSLIGTLLTALVVAREWEHGTMEALISTPIRVLEFIAGKITPYFFLGLGSMTLCLAISIIFFGVPFRGSFLVVYLSTSVFLFSALGQGLFISVTSKNQFLANQFAIMLGFLPAFVLSGFLFEIHSMPLYIQILSYVLPPRYLVSILQTTFLSGTIPYLIVINIIPMLLIAVTFIGLAIKNTRKSLD